MRVIILMLAVICGCVRPAPKPTPDVEGGIIVLSGFTIEAPSDTAWKQLGGGDTEATFEKRVGPLSARLVAQSFPSDSYADDESFLRAAETRQQAAVSELQMLSVHFNRRRLNGATCLQYDGSYSDESSTTSGAKFLNVKGYVCRHPTLAARAVRLEFTQRSTTRFPPGLEDMLATADAFFNSTAFTKSSI